jgi:AGZA family xanthine/uracil permease-like MFS transporter
VEQDSRSRWIADAMPSETILLQLRGKVMLERHFELNRNQTSVRTEVLAGLTTFLTMAYIIFVNPAILADAGMDKGAVFVATCLAAAFGSAFMGLYANYPIALAPGMGLNAYFTYGVVKGMGTVGRRRSAPCSCQVCCFSSSA